jgi:hypothetical protein
MGKVYYIVACLCGESFGRFDSRKEAEEKARAIGQKYIARVNDNKCPGTRGSMVKYRVSK